MHNGGLAVREEQVPGHHGTIDGLKKLGNRISHGGGFAIYPQRIGRRICK